MCKEGWCFGLGQERVAQGQGNCLKCLKMGWNRKEGREAKIKKKGGQAGSRGGLKLPCKL